MPCTLVRLVQFSKVFVTLFLSSDNYISISQLLTYVNTFLKLFLLFCFLFLLVIHHSPYGIRTRVTAVKRRCLNPLTNGPELFNSFYYTYFFSFVKNFFGLFSFYLKSLNTTLNSPRSALRPLKHSPPMRRSSCSCFSLL